VDRNLRVFRAGGWLTGQARKSLWIETICRSISRCWLLGQARKSLWIETLSDSCQAKSLIGQARKSLWIETHITDAM